MSWDHDKLDALLVQIEDSFYEHAREEEASDTPEDECVHRIVGYWMYQLLKCKTGATLRGPGVDGPLFRGVRENGI